MKPNLPILVGAAIVATGLAVLLLWQPDPSLEDLARPALEHHRSIMQGFKKLPGQDYWVDPPIFLSRDDEEAVLRLDIRLPGGGVAREWYRLKRARKGWAFDRDLSQSFTDFAKEQERAILDRLGARLAERVNSSIKIPGENIRISFQLRDDVPPGPRPPDAPPARLIGRVSVQFNDRGAVSMYVEEFAFERGEWRLQGAGSLYDKGPGSK